MGDQIAAPAGGGESENAKPPAQPALDVARLGATGFATCGAAFGERGGKASGDRTALKSLHPD